MYYFLVYVIEFNTLYIVWPYVTHHVMPKKVIVCCHEHIHFRPKYLGLGFALYRHLKALGMLIVLR